MLINAMEVWVIMPKRRERGWIIFQDSPIQSKREAMRERPH